MPGSNPKIRFISKEQEQFYKEMLKKSGVNDSYHRSFFYCMGISEVTRENINKLYNFGMDTQSRGKSGCQCPMSCLAVNLRYIFMRQ